MILDLLYGPDGWFEHCPPPEWWSVYLATNKAPFPWFGGKSKAIDLVWDRFGEVKNYVEPFIGSAAVLLGRPHAPTIETANDFDPFVCNFWRAMQWDPDRVADYADWPVNECDLHARHKYLVKLKEYIRARLLTDPHWYHPMIAGWWVWGLCAWIGSGWCQGDTHNRLPSLQAGSSNGGQKHGKGVHSKSMRLPHLGAGTGGEDDHACAHYGKGVHGKGMRLPDLGATDSGGNGRASQRGVHSQRMRLSEQLPKIGADGGGNEGQSGVHGKLKRGKLHEVFRAIAQRLRYTRITCGDFERILSPAVTWRHGITGVFLDPPYPSDAGSTGGIYSTEAHERETFARAFRYCLENGAHKDLRIALCYYEGTMVRPAPLDGMPVEGPAEDVSHALRSRGWEIVEWLAGGGYSGQSGNNDNRRRERIAFSPHCLKAKQGTLF